MPYHIQKICANGRNSSMVGIKIDQKQILLLTSTTFLTQLQIINTLNPNYSWIFVMKSQNTNPPALGTVELGSAEFFCRKNCNSILREQKIEHSQL
ncbi:hypothetical protein MNBD_BACTEROID03-554 [hydrothermal vent metagenome]|uniref:Uncharacterized protein n=1 Tax=hydrothermal vent metagenome TaxID=652676 RepID=A0A3B0TX79_9ZZZZ